MYNTHSKAPALPSAPHHTCNAQGAPACLSQLPHVAHILQRKVHSEACTSIQRLAGDAPRIPLQAPATTSLSGCPMLHEWSEGITASHQHCDTGLLAQLCMQTMCEHVPPCIPGSTACALLQQAQHAREVHPATCLYGWCWEECIHKGQHVLPGDAVLVSKRQRCRQQTTVAAAAAVAAYMHCRPSLCNRSTC
jgi:hypothetical protein